MAKRRLSVSALMSFLNENKCVKPYSKNNATVCISYIFNNMNYYEY